MRSSALLALLALAPFALAQQAGDVSRLTGTAERPAAPAQPTPASGEAELTAAELDDIGPLQVLATAPAHRWFETGASLDLMFTDNAALLESKTSADITVLHAHAAVLTKPTRVGAGKLSFTGRYDYSAYGYGFLTGRRDHAIDNSVRTIKQLDFQTHGGTAEAEWRTASLTVASGLRGTVYYGTSSGNREYSEIVPYLRAAHTTALSARDFVTVGAEADYRFTDTPMPAPFDTLLGTDLNDRFDIAGTLAYTRLIGDAWFIQPAYRLNYARYTQGGSTPGESGAGAETWINTVSLTAGFAPNAWFTARIYTLFEAREASETTLPDYRVTNIGLGASATVRF